MTHKHEYNLTGYEERTMWVAIYHCKICFKEKTYVFESGRKPMSAKGVEVNVKNSIF
jgi:hypothetical protein